MARRQADPFLYQNTGYTEDLARTYNSLTDSVGQYWSTGNKKGDNQIGRPNYLVSGSASEKTAIWSTKLVDRIRSTRVRRPIQLVDQIGCQLLGIPIDQPNQSTDYSGRPLLVDQLFGRPKSIGRQPNRSTNFRIGRAFGQPFPVAYPVFLLGGETTVQLTLTAPWEIIALIDDSPFPSNWGPGNPQSDGRQTGIPQGLCS